MDILHHRKSIREYENKPLTMDQLSFLLWASTGLQRIEMGYEFRTAPSAGALYPIETYVIINNIETITPGIYHYNIRNHRLEQLRSGDFGEEITKAALHQRMCALASVVFIWTAIFNRSKCKYGQRAYRYIYLDSGHIAENLALAATSLQLGCCHIAAMFDDEVNQLINVDGIRESAIYLSVVGYPVGRK
ncbi:MAG: SagB/ThcOx family dehydrogenase [Candidatus Thermoplasmatota archaeon]|nr:SagB/ThcOx family dehydrogenase [Candidatus Thermoplasmatota archaeon]